MLVGNFTCFQRDFISILQLMVWKIRETRSKRLANFTRRQFRCNLSSVQSCLLFYYLPSILTPRLPSHTCFFLSLPYHRSCSAGFYPLLLRKLFYGRKWVDFMLILYNLINYFVPDWFRRRNLRIYTFYNVIVNVTCFLFVFKLLLVFIRSVIVWNKNSWNIRWSYNANRCNLA